MTRDIGLISRKMNAETLETSGWVMVALISWVMIYRLLCLFNPSRQYEWHCRIVTVLHAILIVGMSGYSALVQGPWPYSNVAGPNTPLQNWTCICTLGYFLFDFLWCLQHQTEGKVMMFHHILSIVGNTTVLYRGHHGTEMMATLFGTEITNPLLQTRWFLRESGLWNTWLAEFVDISFLLLFTLFRIVFASSLLHFYLTHTKPDWFTKLGSIAIYLIGWFFFAAIIRYSIKKYRKKLARCANDTAGATETEFPSNAIQKFVFQESLPDDNGNPTNPEYHASDNESGSDIEPAGSKSTGRNGSTPKPVSKPASTKLLGVNLSNGFHDSEDSLRYRNKIEEETLSTPERRRRPCQKSSVMSKSAGRSSIPS